MTSKRQITIQMAAAGKGWIILAISDAAEAYVLHLKASERDCVCTTKLLFLVTVILAPSLDYLIRSLLLGFTCTVYVVKHGMTIHLTGTESTLVVLKQ